MPKELFDQQLVDEFSGSDRLAGSIPGAAGGVNMLYEDLKAIMRRGAADNWLAQTINARPSIFQVGDKIYALKSDVVLPFQSATSPDIDTINFALIGRMTDDEIINMINARAGDSRIDASAIKNLNTGGAIDASGFNGNLTPTDDTPQKVAQKFDDYVGGGWTENLTAWTTAETTVNLTSNVFRDFGTTPVTVTVNITLAVVTSPKLAEYAFKFVYGTGGSFVYPAGVTLSSYIPALVNGLTYEANIVRGKLIYKTL